MASQSSAFFQPLESRRLLSGTVHVAAHGLLDVDLTGSTANTVTVGYSNLAGDNIVVNIDGVTTTIPQTGSSAQVVKKLHIHCGDGNDSVTITAGDGTTIKEFLIPTTIRGGAGGDTITTGNEVDTIFGGQGHNSITVGNGNDAIFGGSGQDTIVAGNGNDYIFGGGTHTAHGGDSITAGNGNDTIFALAGDDDVTVGSGNDNIYASNGDTVNGGGGSDTVYVVDGTSVHVTGTPAPAIDAISHSKAARRRYDAYITALDDGYSAAAQASNY